MTKKVFNKTIASVLVAALCLVAVFTGAVSATGAVTYTVTGAGYEAEAKDSYVDATVTFTSDEANAFVAGIFTAVADDLTLVDAEVVSFTPAESSTNQGTNPVEHINVSNKKVLFASFSESNTPDMNPLTAISIKLKFYVNAGSIASYSAGDYWDVALSGVDVTNVNEDSYTVTPGAAVPIHIHDYSETDNGAKVETLSCSVCGAEKKVVHNAGDINTTNDFTVDHSNISFTNDGDVVLNALILKTRVADPSKLLFVYTYHTDDGDKTAVATAHTVKGYDSYYAFPCVADSGIGRISRAITGNFIVVDGEDITISSTTWTYSVLDWINATIAANANADAVNYAKALFNYAKATAEQIGIYAYTSAYEAINDGNYYAVSGYSLESIVKTASITPSTAYDPSWNISGISVTTGFKPKMNIRFKEDAGQTISNKESVTIEIRDGENKLLYSKEVAVGNLQTINDKPYTYVLSDVPTKYLVNDILIGVKDSNKTITYSYAKYAKARVGKADAQVFQCLMDYATALAVAFPS